MQENRKLETTDIGGSDMVSIKDIAQKCGVSAATVSKALNGYADISAEKRAEIEKTARDMGYLPNSFARALKTNRTYNLGILFADEAHSGLTHNYFSGILQSFKVTAEQKGYDITFTNCGKTAGRYMNYYEHCRYRGLDGVVIACIDFYTPQTQELIRSDVPVVTIDHVFDGRTAVVSDNVKGMRDLVEYVYGQGHRKIAYIHGADSAVTKMRLNSFYQTITELGIDLPNSYVREAPYRDVEETGRVTDELLSLPNPPTCILYPDDFSALGGIRAICSRGLRIPDDISVVGYDGSVLSEVMWPRLTTLRQDTETIGRVAAQELIRLIEKPKTTLPRSILVEGTLIPGESVKQLDKSEGWAL